MLLETANWNRGQRHSAQVTACFILILNREKSNEGAHWLVTSSYRYTSTNNTTRSWKSTPDNRSNIIEEPRRGWRNPAAEPELIYKQNTVECEEFWQETHVCLRVPSAAWQDWRLKELASSTKKEEIMGIITTTLHAHAQKLAWIVMYSLGHERSVIIYSTAHWNITKREPSNGHDGGISINSDVVDVPDSTAQICV